MLEQRTQEIDELALRNLDIIENNMRAFALLLYTGVGPELLASRGFNPDILDPQKATLSEMPLCNSLYLFSKVFNSLGFSLTSGSTLFRTDSGSASGIAAHVYFSTRLGNEVICFTPGQFVDFKNAPERKGLKIDTLIQEAPYLIRKLTSEVSILRGEMTEISDCLDLLYLPVPCPEPNSTQISQIDSQLILH